MRILNLGCGSNKIQGTINVDCSSGVNPDLVFDIRERFPLEDESFDKVFCFHCIEHIEKHKRGGLLREIRRVLVPNGHLVLSYPEFGKILQNWLSNKGGDRDFWEATIYGRQLYPGDYHYAAIDSLLLKEDLEVIGFKIDALNAEPVDEFNTVLKATRGTPMITYEELVYQEIFANG